MVILDGLIIFLSIDIYATVDAIDDWEKGVSDNGRDETGFGCESRAYHMGPSWSNCLGTLVMNNLKRKNPDSSCQQVAPR